MRMILAACFIIVAAWATAQPVEELTRPGVVALVRHALAPGTGGPAEFDLGDCTTQRNLDARGRAQALRAAGVRFDAVWTSR